MQWHLMGQVFCETCFRGWWLRPRRGKRHGKVIEIMSANIMELLLWSRFSVDAEKREPS